MVSVTKLALVFLDFYHSHITKTWQHLLRDRSVLPHSA